MANGFQRFANRALQAKNLPWVCRREVLADGSCFYDAVLANTEDKDIAPTVPDRFYELQRRVMNDPEIIETLNDLGVEMTEVRVVRLALARFMDTDETLQGLEWFKLYKDITLDDPPNKGCTWEEYLLKVGYTNEYADQLQGHNSIGNILAQVSA